VVDTAGTRPQTDESPPSSPGRRHAAPSRWRGIVPPVLAVVAYTVLGMLGIGTGSPVSTTTLPSCGCGDLASQEWFGAWPAWAITHLHNPLYSSYVDAPHGISLMTNTAAPLLGVVFAPVTWILNPTATLNLTMRLALVFSGIAMCFVLRRWTTWWPAAFVGGLLYEFSPFMVGQSQSHNFLTFAPLPPLVLLLLDNILVRRTRPVRNGILLGVVVSAQFLISPEILAMCAVAAIGAVVVLALRYPVRALASLGAVVRGGVAAVVTLVVLSAYPLWVYLRGPYHVAGPPHPIDELSAYNSSPLSLIYPTDLERIRLGSWGVRGMTLIQGNGVEHTSYLGVPMLVVLAFLVVRAWRRSPVLLFALVALGGWAVAIGDVNRRIAPYHWLAKIPLVNGGLDLRYSYLLYFGVAVVLAVGLDTVRTQGIWPRRRRVGTADTVVAVVLAVVALVPLIPNLPMPRSNVVPPAAFTAARTPLSGGVIALVEPVPLNYIGFDDEALLWQAVGGMRIKLVGFRGAVAGPNHQPIRNQATLLTPPQAEEIMAYGTYGEPALPPYDAATFAAIRDVLAANRIGVVAIAETTPRTPTVVRYFTAALGVPPIRFGGVTLWPDVARDLARRG
jgi:hypothetical protein